jgi:hypothetical protein
VARWRSGGAAYGCVLRIRGQSLAQADCRRFRETVVDLASGDQVIAFAAPDRCRPHRAVESEARDRQRLALRAGFLAKRRGAGNGRIYLLLTSRLVVHFVCRGFLLEVWNLASVSGGAFLQNDAVDGGDQCVADADGQHHADDNLVSIELALRLGFHRSGTVKGTHLNLRIRHYKITTSIDLQAGGCSSGRTVGENHAAGAATINFSRPRCGRSQDPLIARRNH